MVDRVERAPWDRRPGEPARVHAAFRVYRDAGPPRTLRALDQAAPRTIARWSARWDWPARAVAWDDECHRAADAARLEELRGMHGRHVEAGRAAVALAREVLAELDAADVSAAAAAKLLEIGARLERDMLTIPVEDLQGVPRSATVDDPWGAIARELGAADS